MITIPFHGGHQIRDSMAGITDLDMAHTPAEFYDIVASHVYDHHLLTLDGYHNVGYKIPTDQSIHMYPYLYKFS